MMRLLKVAAISALLSFVTLWLAYLLLVAVPEGRCVSGTLCPHGSKGIDAR